MILLRSNCYLLRAILMPLTITSLCSLCESVDDKGWIPSCEAETHYYNSILDPYEPHSCLLTSSLQLPWRPQKPHLCWHLDTDLFLVVLFKFGKMYQLQGIIVLINVIDSKGAQIMEQAFSGSSQQALDWREGSCEVTVIAQRKTFLKDHMAV